MTQKVQAAVIIIKRVTGLTSQLSEQTFSHYEHANDLWEQVQLQLNTWAYAVSMGYDDIDFKVIFADGYIYNGTLELCNPTQNRWKNETIEEHIKKHCLTYSGRESVERYSAEQQEIFLNTFAPEPHRSECARILDTYQLGD